MDVTCEQCKAEYDFDDTLLGDKGTTVKCSQCGHVFRVLPPRREPQRSALKVRFAHDGHIETVGSLRELQQRIQSGDVGVDDELGRDGFTFRKLRDVPELKNFFTRGAGPSKNPEARGEPSQPPERQPKRTVLGLGPNAHEVPTSPRMQGLGPGGLAAQALAPTQPGGPPPKATLQGRAPISAAPTSPMREAHREPPSRRVPISSAPTPSGTAPTIESKAPLYGTNQNNAPTVAPPATYPESIARAPAAAPSVLRISEPERPDARAPEPRRGSAGDSIGPGALRAAARPRTASTPPSAAPGRKVRLRVEDDESPPERASGGSSKLLMLIGLAAVLGVGGFFAKQQLSGALQVAEPGAGTTPEVALDAATSAAPLAEPPASSDADAALAAQAPEPEPAPAPAAPPEPAPAPSAPPEPQKVDKPAASKPTAARTPEKEPEPPAAPAGGGREPKDYSGWVARGGQLLSRGDISGARAAFEAAVALRGTGSEANSGLGSVLLALGQTREAIPYLERAASNGFAEASVGLGDAYRKLGQADAAIEAYETYLARMPKGGRANYVRLQLEGLGKKETPREETPRAEAPSRPSSNEYRPAGELTEPAPAPPTQPGENTP